MMLSGHSVSNPNAINYFSIKSSEKSGWMHLEDFYNNRYTKNPKIKFTYDQVSKYRYMYRSTEYKYSSFIDMLPQLSMPDFYTASMIRSEYLNFSKKYGYCIRLLDTLNRYIQKARFETIKAATIFDIDYLNSDSLPKTYYWYYLQRCFNAENAIYSYYATYEILALLVWICKDYYLDKPHETFESISKNCKSQDLRNKLKSDDRHIFDLLAEPNKSINKKFAKVVKWCNTFKHRGILRFDGEHESNRPTILCIPNEYGNAEGIEQFSNSDWDFKYVDLEKDVIPTLVKYHKDILEVSSEIIRSYLTSEGQ